MPRYDYRCPNGHTHERLRPSRDSAEPSPCPECGANTERLFTAPHVPPDGIYSYAPNVGSEAAFERKRAAMKNGERVYKKEAT